MDIEFFLKERTAFISYFYENASRPFIEIMTAIEKEEEPYVPPYSEDGEPPFLSEWGDAKTGLETVGHSAISMLSSSLQLFLKAWVDRLDKYHGMTFKVNFKKKGWLNGYKEIWRQMEMNISECPANLDTVEQITLARNRSQHPEDITTLDIWHSENDLKKHPRPFFLQDSERLLLDKGEDEQSWLSRPAVIPTAEKVEEAISQVNILCSWLDSEYWNASNT